MEGIGRTHGVGRTDRRWAVGLFAGISASLGAAGAAQAADLAAAPQPVEIAEPPPAWSFRFVPYGWLTALDGTQTVRGRSAKVNLSFLDIVEKSDTLVALMGDFEARKGPFAVYADVVWSKIGASAGDVKTRAPAPGITGVVGRSLSLDIEMAIAEVGAAYEFARFGALSFDVVAGARYWYQQADLSLDLTGTFDVGDLTIVGSRGIARSGSVEWLDPLIGARLRYSLFPGHELFLRGDVGGFGVGSDFSWQAVGGYIFDFATRGGTTYSGVIGYRALAADYSQGAGRRLYEFDIVQHGPVLGLSIRF
jgi:hypothetical protein